jgi:hypothetical protein
MVLLLWWDRILLARGFPSSTSDSNICAPHLDGGDDWFFWHFDDRLISSRK